MSGNGPTTDSSASPGWFRVANVEDIPAGTVRRAQCLGLELIVWRAQSTGSIQVMDAYCPHLGAHIAFGGRVEGDTVRCPFHGWLFDANGVCIEVPYSPTPHRNARVRAYPVFERDGTIFALNQPAVQ